MGIAIKAGLALALALGVAVAAASCGVPAPAQVWGNCPLDATVRCCPCPADDYCVNDAGVYVPKPIPWDCPNACDGPDPRPPRCYPDGGAPDGGDMDASTGFCAGGTCAPPAPDGWKAIAFVSSWASDPPACPPDAPNLVFEGSAAPPPPTCGTCSCDEPGGTCAPPTSWSISSVACTLDPNTGIKTNFDPPAGWDGACDESKSILEGKLCGGVPCVKSLVISPPVVTEGPCTPHVLGDPEQPAPRLWNGGPTTPLGRACASDKPAPPCVGQAGACFPGGSSFSACVMQEGEFACPDGFADKHLLYGHIEDSRSCSACECGPPTGSFCKMKYRIFSAPGCTVETSAEDISTVMTPPCRDFMGGTALSGKTAEITQYTKGSCAPSGGEVMGDIVVEQPTTICCHVPIE